MNYRKLPILIAVCLVSLARGQGSFGDTDVNGVQPSTWGAAWVQHPDDANALTDLGFSTWQQARIDANQAEADAAYQRTYNVVAYGADPTGSADSTAAIFQACNDANDAGGGVVLFPQGVYKVIPTQPAGYWTTAAIWIRDGVSFVGQGRAIIRQYDEGNLFAVDRLDGGGSGTHDDVTITRLELDANRAGWSTTDANDGFNEVIYLENSSRFRLQNCFIHDSIGFGIFVHNGCYDVTVSNNIFESCGGSPRAAHAVYFTNRDARWQVHHNLIRNAAGSGVQLTNEGPYSTESWEISDNTIVDCNYFGVNIIDSINGCDGAGTDGYARYGSITGNRIVGCGTIGSGFRGGIQIANVIGAVGGGEVTHMQDIDVSGNIIAGCENHGITLRSENVGDIRRIEVRANTIISCTGSPIYMYADTAAYLEDCTLEANTFYDCGGALTTAGNGILLPMNYYHDTRRAAGSYADFKGLGIGNGRYDIGYGYQFDVNDTSAGGSIAARVYNKDNSTAASGAYVTVSVGGTSAGDPAFYWGIPGAVNYGAWLDNSDSDKWKLGADPDNPDLTFKPSDHSMWLYIDGGVKAVSVGAGDSGGSGYKLLRVPN